MSKDPNSPASEHQTGEVRVAGTRSSWRWVALLSIAFAAIALLALLRPKPEPPNVLVISLCSVRYDHLGYHGYPRDTSPNLDRLAAESIVFDHAVTQWPKTAPAFATLMTGKYAHTTGVARITPDQFLGDDHATLAELLGDAGYDTAAFNSTPALNPVTNILQGFEYLNDTYKEDRPYRGVTDAAIDWLMPPRERPFFAWVHFNNAHHPYSAPEMPADLFMSDEHYRGEPVLAPLPPEPLDLPVSENHPFRRQILRPDIGGVHRSAAMGRGPTEIGYYVARYDAGIASADKMIGEVLDAMRDSGLLENTIVVVVCDHGESMGKHDYYFGHGRLPYDDCARVPFLIRRPGEARQQRIAAPVPTFALAPTILEMLSLPIPEAMEAPSLGPLMRGGDRPRYVFTESGYQIDYTLAVRDAAWKLIYTPNEIDQSLQTGALYELYHIATDPGETTNLYDERPNMAARLRHVLHEWSEPWIDYAYGKLPQKPPVVDDATLQRLKALGYID